jgi:hypothetical protein
MRGSALGRSAAITPDQDHRNMNAPIAETQPSELFMGFILSLLAPLLTIGGITDPDLARRAAAETIAAYRAAAPNRSDTIDQLISIAQIVAFALASLDAIRLSLPADLALPMKLKLRCSANALSRSSQRAAATLDRQRRNAAPLDAAPAEQDPSATLACLETAKTVVRQATATQPATPATDRQADLSWANAMTDVATEYSAELAELPPVKRRTHLARIGALAEIATTLGRGDAPPLKARLLGTTSLRG